MDLYSLIVSLRTRAFPFLLLAVVLLVLDLAVSFVVIQQRNQAIAIDTATIKALNATNQSLVAGDKNRQYTIWNSCSGPCTIGPRTLPTGGTDNPVRAGGVPDTFDLILAFTATTPVAVHFLTLRGWAEFASKACDFKISCVDVSERSVDLGPTTNLPEYTFKDAEGCADYIIVFQAAATGVITPDERVHYNPASIPTGSCA